MSPEPELIEEKDVEEEEENEEEKETVSMAGSVDWRERDVGYFKCIRCGKALKKDQGMKVC